MAENSITASIVSIIMVIGIFDNVLVCLAYYRFKEIRTFAGLLVCNLAIADVLQCLNMIFIIVSLIYDKWMFGDFLCQVCGVTNICFIQTSILALTIISINRYAVVVKGQQLAFFSKRNTRILLIFAWVIPILTALLPVFGWSEYTYIRGKYMCTLDFLTSYSYSIFVISIAMILPFMVMFYCNIFIIRVIWINRGKRERTAVNERRRKENVRVSIMVLVVIITFMFFYVPIMTVTIVSLANGTGYKLPVWIDSLTVVIAMLNHANNPLIYGIMNHSFRRAFKTMLCRKRRKRRRIAPATLELMPQMELKVPEHRT